MGFTVCSENVVCFLRLLCIFKCIADFFSVEANTMNADPTAPKGLKGSRSDLDPPH